VVTPSLLAALTLVWWAIWFDLMQETLAAQAHP
jgi:hypothetical protein